MGELFIYIMKSAICLIMFLLFYKITLSNETFHRFNRFALLGIILFSMIVPAINIGSPENTEILSTSVIIEEAAISAEAMSPAPLEYQDETDMKSILIMSGYIIYLSGIVFFMLRNIFSFIKILRITNSGTRESLCKYIGEEGSKYKLTVTEKSITPFSWMNHIIISRSDLQGNGREILTHEMAHARNRHSLDLILADLCIVLQWFNPAAWILKTELQNIHEFEADETVINQGIDAKNYQLLLIKKAVGSRLYSIANSFNHSKLKKRITMMMKKKSNPWARAKYLYVLPLAAVAVAAFARPEVSAITEEISSVKVNDFSAITENHETENHYSVSDKSVIVEGTVIDDATGDPIVGASVIVRNTTNGTITDIDGKFKIETPADGVLVFSYIGKQTYSIILSEKNIKSMKESPIRLKEETQNMDEVVVVGYEQEKEQGKSPEEEAAPQAPTSKDDEPVFMIVEQMPEYPGGMSECMKYIARNIKYPMDAQREKIQGRVIVQFIVGTDGYTSDFKIMRGVSPSLDAEAIRVLANMPKWSPGMQRGKAVPVKFTIPVTFKLEKQEKAEPQPVANNTVMPGNVSFNKSIENTLILIDDKAASQKEFVELNPSNIESITVIKEKKQAQEILQKYNAENKDGVIIIKTKAADGHQVLTLKVDDMTDSKTVNAIKDKLRGDVQKVNMSRQ